MKTLPNPRGRRSTTWCRQRPPARAVGGVRRTVRQSRPRRFRVEVRGVRLGPIPPARGVPRVRALPEERLGREQPRFRRVVDVGEELRGWLERGLVPLRRWPGRPRYREFAPARRRSNPAASPAASRFARRSTSSSKPIACSRQLRASRLRHQQLGKGQPQVHPQPACSSSARLELAAASADADCTSSSRRPVIGSGCVTIVMYSVTPATDSRSKVSRGFGQRPAERHPRVRRPPRSVSRARADCSPTDAQAHQTRSPSMIERRSWTVRARSPARRRAQLGA